MNVCFELLSLLLLLSVFTIFTTNHWEEIFKHDMTSESVEYSLCDYYTKVRAVKRSSKMRQHIFEDRSTAHTLIWNFRIHYSNEEQNKWKITHF